MIITIIVLIIVTVILIKINMYMIIKDNINNSDDKNDAQNKDNKKY